MSKMISDDELAATMRDIVLTDPLPDVDPSILVVRGRRGLRRRRHLTVASLGVVVAAVAAASATVVPLALGSREADPAGTPASGASPSSATTPRRAEPSDDAALLEQCGKSLGADLSDWRIKAKGAEPGYLTVITALDRAGKRSATCYLPGRRLPFSIPPQWNWIATVGRPPTSVITVDAGDRGTVTRHMFEQGSATCSDTNRTKCVGFLFYETDRLPLRAARIHAVATNGRAVDVPVVDGWYAVAWANRDPRGMTPVTWTVYDAHGKVLGSNR